MGSIVHTCALLLNELQSHARTVLHDAFFTRALSTASSRPVPVLYCIRQHVPPSALYTSSNSPKKF